MGFKGLGRGPAVGIRDDPFDGDSSAFSIELTWQPHFLYLSVLLQCVRFSLSSS